MWEYRFNNEPRGKTPEVSCKKTPHSDINLCVPATDRDTTLRVLRVELQDEIQAGVAAQAAPKLSPRQANLALSLH